MVVPMPTTIPVWCWEAEAELGKSFFLEKCSAITNHNMVYEHSQSYCCLSFSDCHHSSGLNSTLLSL